MAIGYTSFNVGASSWTVEPTNAQGVNNVYTLLDTWTDSILTVGGSWKLGDIIDITFDFVGVYDVVNFDVSNFGVSNGIDTSGNIVTANENLVTSVKLENVPL